MKWANPRRLPLFERIPVRWRIAITTAGLTLLILVIFALVLGQVVGNRIRSDFRSELRSASSALAAETRVGEDISIGVFVRRSPDLRAFALPEDAQIKVLDQFGNPIPGAATNPNVNLGSPSTRIRTVGGLSVATAPVTAPDSLPAFVQYARPSEGVNETVARLWFFLGAGVLGGTLLAMLAGLAVADRAMRPIKSLTGLARQITSTRDPSKRIPTPAADDEVGELARTMDGMLQALDEARSEREQALERQREFVADASHELRTPLTSIQANLELLLAAEHRLRGRPPRGRIGALIHQADVGTGLGPPAARPRRCGPPGRPHRSRPGPDRGGRPGGGPAARRRTPAGEPPGGSAADVRQPRRAPPADPQPARERRPSHAREDHRRAHRSPGRRRGAARGARRRPGHPRRNRGAGLRSLRPGGGPGRHHREGAAAGSVWRSFAQSRNRTAAPSTPGRASTEAPDSPSASRSNPPTQL